MINIIKNWCEGIIVAIMISIIIELLLPNDNNKKYVKVVSGIYIMFVVLNPILNILQYDIDLENIFSYKEKIKEENYEETVMQDLEDIYVVGIKESIKNDVENIGYEVKDIKITLDENYENITEIKLKVIENKSNIKNIENVEIGKERVESSEEYAEIIDFLNNNYLISKEKIFFVEN